MPPTSIDLYINPTMAPATSHPPWNPASSMAFYCANCASGDSSWSSAVIVGQNIQKPVDTSTDITNNIQTWTCPCSASTATVRISSPRAASSTMTTDRKSVV